MWPTEWAFSGCYLHVIKLIKQESPPAWTQEAYRPPCSEYSLCCPTRVPPRGGTWPGYPPGGVQVPPGGVPDPGTPPGYPLGGTWPGSPPGGVRVPPRGGGWGVPDPGTPRGGLGTPLGGTWPGYPPGGSGYPPGGYLTQVPPGGVWVPPWGGTWPGYPPGGTWPGYPPRVPPRGVPDPGTPWGGPGTPLGGYLTRVPPPGGSGYPPAASWHSGKCCKALWDMGTPPVDRQIDGWTDACQNITFPRTTYAGGNNFTYFFIAATVFFQEIVTYHLHLTNVQFYVWVCKVSWWTTTFTCPMLETVS